MWKSIWLWSSILNSLYELTEINDQIVFIPKLYPMIGS